MWKRVWIGLTMDRGAGRHLSWWQENQEKFQLVFAAGLSCDWGLPATPAVREKTNRPQAQGEN